MSKLGEFWEYFGFKDETLESYSKRFTPPKFNMEPENHPLVEKENTSSKSSFLGSMLVFGGVLKYGNRFLNYCLHTHAHTDFFQAKLFPDPCMRALWRAFGRLLAADF